MTASERAGVGETGVFSLLFSRVDCVGRSVRDFFSLPFNSISRSMLSTIALSVRLVAVRLRASSFRATSSHHSKASYLNREFRSPVTGKKYTLKAVAMASSSPLPPPSTLTNAADAVAVVYCTAPSPEVARSLARHLVQEPQRLAACVNVCPGLTSIYSWKGKVEEDSEVLMIIKTKKELLPALTEEIKAKHPYDEPEVLALPVIGGSESYLRWVDEETKKKEEGK